ncbi:hypothetical protein GPJ56_009148 [Histomonas meleagridis]|uniref:uncharacterized protein n=1 Tax=Histomonas meleagridis TaxID=135588 RepID=UPI00355AAB72|nr:hypothetical protein GPJ56_009148 [Histomonas meleagridis]KAH0799098.1 hypothetical protein GO595_007895 [Histomonas meleagridis]
MNKKRFQERIKLLGIDIDEQGVDYIWDKIGVSGKFIRFDDFTKLMMKSLNLSLVTDQPISLIDALKNNTKLFLNSCIDYDPSVTGFISYREFITIANFLAGSCDSSELENTLLKYDTRENGLINYFYLLGDISEEINLSPRRSVPSTPSPRQSRRLIDSPPNDFNSYSTPTRGRSYSSRERISSPVDLIRTPRKSPPPLDPNLSQPTPHKPRSPVNFENVFKTPSKQLNGRLETQPLTVPAKGRNLFETKDQPPKHKERLFDYSNAERVDGLSTAEYIELIAKQISCGSRECFMKWRGQHMYVDAYDLRNGFAKDSNIIIPYKEAKAIVRTYGGKLTLSSFVRMLADGNRLAELNKSKNVGSDYSDF